jgi:hypothetical protein
MLEKRSRLHTSHRQAGVVDEPNWAVTWPAGDVDRATPSIPDRTLSAPSRLTRATPWLRMPRLTTCLRVALGLIWLVAAVSHMFWGGPHPCTCAHP